MKFEKLLDDIRSSRPNFSFILGDFNARSTSWYDCDVDSFEGTKLFSLTSSCGFQQTINEPTHLLKNSSSCIDLIFTDQPYLVIDSGVHSSLHENCHHQIIYSKFNLKIEYPPPYQQLIWEYKKAKIENIKQAVEMVNWKGFFLIKAWTSN